MTNEQAIHVLTTNDAVSANDFAEAMGKAVDALDKTRWISVKDAMPPEHETIFAKYKGTSKWRSAMFERASDDVRIIAENETGDRIVSHDNTVDGVWRREKTLLTYYIVTHWMPNPELPEK